jgi:hypothetical protein
VFITYSLTRRAILGVVLAPRVDDKARPVIPTSLLLTQSEACIALELTPYFVRERHLSLAEFGRHEVEAVFHAHDVTLECAPSISGGFRHVGGGEVAVECGHDAKELVTFLFVMARHSPPKTIAARSPSRSGNPSML